MKLTKEEIKKQYYDRIYTNAPMIYCACGCGEQLKSKDHYGRDRHYIRGHHMKKYDDPKEYKRAWHRRNRDKAISWKTKKMHQFRRELIQSAGGRCSVCGFDFDGECTSIFEFHHRDPTTKLFNVCASSLNRYSMQRVRDEADKCDLFCVICHRLIHWDWEFVNTADPQKELETPMTEEKV